MAKYVNDYAADNEDDTLYFINEAITYGLKITFKKGSNGYPEFELRGPKDNIVEFCKDIYDDPYAEDEIIED